MGIKKKRISSQNTVTIIAAIALTATAGPVGAAVYAGSSLTFAGLSVVISGATPPGVTQFDFNAENSAVLNGVSSPNRTATCGGLPGDPGVGTNDCGPAGARLDAMQAIAPGGSIAPAENTFTFQGPNNPNEQFARADSLLSSAQLTGDIPGTAFSQIAETELQTRETLGTGSANAELGSTTGFNFTFAVGGPVDLGLTFEATPDLFVEIGTDGESPASARASLDVEFTLTEDSTGDTVVWAPNGQIQAGDCDVDITGVTCTEDDDDLNLNRGLAITQIPSSATFSPGIGTFGITISGLGEGVYTLSQTATSNVAARNGIPAPGALLLLGSGLFSLGWMRRRRQSAV